MINLTLKARVRYLLYIAIYCKRIHYTADSLVWGLLRLTPIRNFFFTTTYTNLISNCDDHLLIKANVLGTSSDLILLQLGVLGELRS